MKEELKRRAKDYAAYEKVGYVHCLIRDLLAECERMNRIAHGGVQEVERLETRIAEIEQRAREQPKPEPVACQRAYLIKHSNGEESFTRSAETAQFYAKARVATVETWFSAPPAIPDVADDRMIEEGILSLERSLKKFPDNMAQVVSNVYEDMLNAAPPAIPEGYALVPIEPTMAMKLAGDHVDNTLSGLATCETYWYAMIAAAKVQQP